MIDLPVFGFDSIFLITMAAGPHGGLNHFSLFLMHAFLTTLLDGLMRAAGMAWQTWWALVLGFTIAGAVESFVSEKKMSQMLGGGGLKSILLGTLFGAASSSCSYGAVATTKALFKKGASPEASFGAFQFASTNLVIELGLVMWVLLGWQFVVANAAAGLVMIFLLVLVFRWLVPRGWFDDAREHLQRAEGVRDPQCGMEVDPEADDVVKLEQDGQTLYFCSTGCRDAYRERDDEAGMTERLMTRRGWTQAFRNALGEWRMLWKDIALGFLIAGLIAAIVPRGWWTTLFAFGGPQTFWVVVASAILGVVIGVATFVCSVGNVPFALILWKNGIAFSGVMSFILSDLIVPPIVHAYRRYYGWRLALVLLAAIFLTAVLAGVIVHYLWNWIGFTPAPGQLGGTAPGGYTLYLNLAFSLLFAVQIHLARKTKAHS